MASISRIGRIERRAGSFRIAAVAHYESSDQMMTMRARRLRVLQNQAGEQSADLKSNGSQINRDPQMTLTQRRPK